MSENYPGEDSVQEDTPVVEQPLASERAAPVPPVEDTAAANSNADPTGQSSTSVQSERRSTRSQSNAVASKKAADIKDPNTVDTGDENVVIKGDSIWVGNVLVNKGKIVTPGGFNFNMQPPNVRIPNVPIDPRNLTPEQRRKLRLLRQQHPEMFPRPSPTPQN